MKNKKWLLILIIIIPSLFWVILESSTINSYKLPFFGPKQAIAARDTAYYQVPDNLFYSAQNYSPGLSPYKIETGRFPIYAIVFIKDEYANDSYRIAGLWEYLNYKKEKIEHIPFFLVSANVNDTSKVQQNLQQLSKSTNVTFLSANKQRFDSLNAVYFKGKPVHIDYSFIALIDSERRIRGYYDARYAAEIKRLTDEYKHLRLKDEKEKMLRENEIKDNK